MALHACRECGKPVSTEALACPSCGVPNPTGPARRAQRPPADTSAAPAGVADAAGNALGWVIGVVIALSSIGAFATDFVGGLFFLAAAAAVLPPVNAWLKRSIGITFSPKAKLWLVFGLFVAGALAIAAGETRQQESARARAADARRQAARVDFAANRPAIIARMDSALRARNYSLAASIGLTYAGAVTDSQLARLTREAQAGQTREANRAKERQLLAQAAVTPASNLEGKRDLYRQLVALNPTNTSYKAKLDDYSKRIQQEQAAQQDRIRRFGPIPRASEWDGTYREVKDYLRQVANDPDRLKIDACTPVYHVETGWLVGCDYRGANAFGGMVRASNWFIIRQGRVVQMKEASAYRP